MRLRSTWGVEQNFQKIACSQEASDVQFSVRWIKGERLTVFDVLASGGLDCHISALPAQSAHRSCDREVPVSQNRSASNLSGRGW